MIEVVRRIKREVIERRNPRTGQLERIETTVQTSNLYRFISTFSGLLVKIANLFTAKPVSCSSQQLALNLTSYGDTPQAVESVERMKERTPLSGQQRPLKFGLIDLT